MADKDIGGPPQSQALSETKPRKGKVMIALLGVTGAGKSTFINTALGRDLLKTSHGSKPCTQSPQSVELKVGERPIVLIDTPGFDDDKRSDVRILEDIATWMAKRGYMKLDGLIFLHPITHTRAGGSELNRTQLLEKILGEAAYSRVVIATTMWDYIASESSVQERVNSRFAPGGVWHELRSKGADHVKHYNNQQSAHEIVNRIVDITDRLGKPDVLLEGELRQRQGRVVQTSAGRTLEKQIQRKITVLQDEIYRHLEGRPDDSYKNDKVPAHRTEWKRWNKEHRELQVQLASEQQELKKLQNIVVRFFYSLASIFRTPR
ncbi:P-loop containing nucleoside triphosphate hydrolase protein [Cercophora newfieldiana]|uniref:P-loop containing nucleoside triphosphate hydrolase protein n=1 Tax=Cercophora newfieldiana TaxID=92897 RepID=A0AA39YIK3_9PEZI|nr:P-loop containing nucleoside triphosphate hydrolase protein [Cercophora newfieldiana]